MSAHDGGDGEQSNNNNSNSRAPPMQKPIEVDVTEVEGGLYIFIQCEKRPGLVVDLVSTLEHTGLNFSQTNVYAEDSIILDAFGTQSKTMPYVHAETLKEVLNEIILSHI